MSKDGGGDGNVVEIFSRKNVSEVHNQNSEKRDGIYKDEADMLEKVSNIFNEEVRPEQVVGSFIVFVVKDSDGDATPIMASMCQTGQEYNLIGSIEKTKSAFIGCIGVNSIEQYSED